MVILIYKRGAQSDARIKTEQVEWKNSALSGTMS